MKNIKFYSNIFGEDGHLDKKISSSLTKQLILMYFKDIKKINKKEIEPQLEQTVLNRLNNWITEFVGKIIIWKRKILSLIMIFQKFLILLLLILKLSLQCL